MNMPRVLSAGWPTLRRLLPALSLLGLLALLVSGCDTDTPQNALHPAGDVASKQKDLFLLAMWPALVVMILVEGAIIVMLLRFRRRKDDQIPKQTHGNTPLEITWTIIPTLLILGFVGVPMMPVLFEIGREPKADAYPINVTGQRFVWEFGYPELGLDNEGKPLVTTLSELHIPAGREIALTLTSIDVIHSFGVPRLAGTRDAIPGHEERMWIKVDQPGSYAGQCRELCGIGHAGMKITVIAQSEEDFQAWIKEAKAAVKGTDDGSGDVVSAGARNGE